MQPLKLGITADARQRYVNMQYSVKERFYKKKNTTAFKSNQLVLSAREGMQQIPSYQDVHSAKCQNRAFGAAASNLWNSLPLYIR